MKISCRDLDYPMFGLHDGMGYGNPSSSAYFNRPSGNYAGDRYERNLEEMDYSRSRSYDLDPRESGWGGYDEYLRLVFSLFVFRRSSEL